MAGKTIFPIWGNFHETYKRKISTAVDTILRPEYVFTVQISCKLTPVIRPKYLLSYALQISEIHFSYCENLTAVNTAVVSWNWPLVSIKINGKSVIGWFFVYYKRRSKLDRSRKLNNFSEKFQSCGQTIASNQNKIMITKLNKCDIF